MGRFYSGDINGKFWFGIQDSDDISNLINVSYYRDYCWKICGCIADINKHNYCSDCYTSIEDHINEAVDEEEYENECLYYKDETINYLLDNNSHSDELLINMNTLSKYIPMEIIDEFNKIPESDSILNTFSGVFENLNNIVMSFDFSNYDKEKLLIYIARYSLGFQIKYCLKTKESCYISCEC